MSDNEAKCDPTILGLVSGIVAMHFVVTYLMITYPETVAPGFVSKGE